MQMLGTKTEIRIGLGSEKPVARRRDGAILAANLANTVSIHIENQNSLDHRHCPEERLQLPRNLALIAEKVIGQVTGLRKFGCECGNHTLCLVGFVLDATNHATDQRDRTFIEKRIGIGKIGHDRNGKNGRHGDCHQPAKG